MQSMKVSDSRDSSIASQSTTLKWCGSESKKRQGHYLSITVITNSESIWESENSTENQALTKPNPVLFEDCYLRWHGCRHTGNSKHFRISTPMMKKQGAEYIFV